MTFRNRDETFSPTSEVFSPFSPGSVLFSEPSEEDQWSRPVPSHLPPTPESDCFLSDFCQDLNPEMSRDMSLPYDWTPTTSSEDTWTTTSAPVERNTMPYETSLWPTSGYAAYQDLPSSDDAAWYPAVHGSVVGLSPVLSQMSQNSHTLHFFPELDTFPTGHKVDHFPLPSEAHQWNLSDGLALGSFLTPDACSSLSQGLPSSETTFPDLSVDSPALCAVQQPLLLFPDGQSCESRRSFSEPNVGHGRRLLPRTPQALPMSRSQSSSQYRAIQPHSVVASSTFAETEGNIPVLPKAPASRGATLSEPLAASVCRPTATSEVAYAQDQLSGPEVSSAINSGLPAVYLQTADFEDYRYHGEFDQTCAQPTSHIFAYNLPQTYPMSISAGSAQSTCRLNVTTTSLSTEGDEGRYRTNALYKEGPKADGLYHCYYEGDASNPCTHKPTKLKCNYDKYIDSHLKPFRCKDGACSKQQFSSMACVLRHEREAHGLHGHGDRPFPCRYVGCERSQLRNGFPRKYNLYDHMRRVHGWKEDEAAQEQENGSLSAANVRKNAPRKRKASASSSQSEPPARKLKSELAV